jgi:hypothetical protein
MSNPNFQRYVSPKERAENRARITRFVLWSGAGIAVLFVVMMYAYSDQAPAGLREFVYRLDGSFGFPVLSLIKAMAG